MKPIRILLIATLAAIMCSSFTSCEKALVKTEITFVNTTSNYGIQIYCDGQPEFSNTWRLWPGESQTELETDRTTNYNKYTSYPVDIKIEYYKMTGYRTFEKNPSYTSTKQNCRFNLGTNYKVTIRDKDFTIQTTY